MFLNGESFGTMTPPYSSISLAIGVVSASVDFDLLVYDAPTTPRPISIAQVAVALLVDRAGQADGAAGAVEVEHLDAAGDLVVLHHLGGGPRGDVVAATGGVGDHDPQVGQRLARVGGVRGLAGDAAAGGQGEREAEDACGDAQHPGAGDR